MRRAVPQDAQAHTPHNLGPCPFDQAMHVSPIRPRSPGRPPNAHHVIASLFVDPDPKNVDRRAVTRDQREFDFAARPLLK